VYCDCQQIASLLTGFREISQATTQYSSTPAPINCYDGVDCVWNAMANAQKPDFVFRWKGRVHLNRLGRQFSRLLAAEVRAAAIVMLDTPCSEVVWGVLVTHSIRQFPLHFPTRASPCAITFQMDSTNGPCIVYKRQYCVAVVKYDFNGIYRMQVVRGWHSPGECARLDDYYLCKNIYHLHQNDYMCS